MEAVSISGAKCVTQADGLFDRYSGGSKVPRRLSPAIEASHGRAQQLYDIPADEPTIASELEHELALHYIKQRLLSAELEHELALHYIKQRLLSVGTYDVLPYVDRYLPAQSGMLAQTSAAPATLSVCQTLEMLAEQDCNLLVLESALYDIPELLPLVISQLQSTVPYNALPGGCSVSTLRFHGSIQGNPVQVLLDGGSTHNFVPTRVAKFLSLPITSTPSFSVLVGSGERLVCTSMVKQITLVIQGHEISVDFYVLPSHGWDIVLGVAWLATLGPVVTNYASLTFEFSVDGNPVRWTGESAPLAQAIQFQGLRQAEYFLLEMGQSSKVDLAEDIGKDGDGDGVHQPALFHRLEPTDAVLALAAAADGDGNGDGVHQPASFVTSEVENSNQMPAAAPAHHTQLPGQPGDQRWEPTDAVLAPAPAADGDGVHQPASFVTSEVENSDQMACSSTSTSSSHPNAWPTRRPDMGVH